MEDRKKMQARTHRFIRQAVYRRAIPNPASLRCADCADCGGQAKTYHHQNGYEGDAIWDVVPLCGTCHWVAHRPQHAQERSGAPALAARLKHYERKQP